MVNLKGGLGAHELTDRKSGLYRALVAEFLGTLLLNFFCCGTAVTGNVVAISLAAGLAVAGAVQGLGHVSGGHINPAVTIGLMTIGKVPLIRAMLYVLAQCVGAIAGSAVLRALSSEEMDTAQGAVGLSRGMTPVQGLGVEFFLALVLVLVICGACDAGKPESKGLAPLIIGLTVTLAHLAGVPRTGAGMNPARSLGSAVVTGLFRDHWLYWVGPILGGIAGGLIYDHAVGPAREPEVAPAAGGGPYASVATDEKERSAVGTTGGDIFGTIGDAGLHGETHQSTSGAGCWGGCLGGEGGGGGGGDWGGFGYEGGHAGGHVGGHEAGHGGGHDSGHHSGHDSGHGGGGHCGGGGHDGGGHSGGGGGDCGGGGDGGGGGGDCGGGGDGGGDCGGGSWD